MTEKKSKENGQSTNIHLDNDSTPSDRHKQRMIYPIIMFPYIFRDARHIEVLYEELIKELSEDTDKYHHPITILDHQTCGKNRYNSEFHKLIDGIVSAFSHIEYTWSVDTCQRWLTGFGDAHNKSVENRRTVDDVFWLIPADFDYGNASGQEALAKIKEIPDKVYKRECDLCLGEITAPPNSSKQLIDTYGTYGLLYNWFPVEAQGIARITSKPRTEFFAIDHTYLSHVLEHRWYGYEQTIVILLRLHRMEGSNFQNKVHKVNLGEIADEPQGRFLAGAIDQIERTERILKLHWRELNKDHDKNWPDKFRKLDAQSEKIRGAALVILEQVLK
jgi:hypothetical protein